jgi:transposase
MIGLGVREAAYELGIGHSTAGRAMQELDDSGLARPMKPGAWRGKKATEWRLMFLRCNKTHEPAVTVWEQRKPLAQSQTGNTKVPNWEHREAVSPKLETQTRNSSMNGESLSPATEAHIHIYQGPGGSAGSGQEGTDLPESHPKLNQINNPKTTLAFFPRRRKEPPDG